MKDIDVDYWEKLSDEEKEWLRSFNMGVNRKNVEILEKLGVDADSASIIRKQEIKKYNAYERDIMNRSVRIRPNQDMVDALGHEEAFEATINLDNLDLEPEVPRKRDDGNYTPSDYMGSDFPNEDTLIAMIDHDRAKEEAKKVKDFMAEKKKRGAE